MYGFMHKYDNFIEILDKNYHTQMFNAVIFIILCSVGLSVKFLIFLSISQNQSALGNTIQNMNKVWPNHQPLSANS